LFGITDANTHYDNDDLVTFNILTSHVNAHTAADAEAGQGLVCLAIPFWV
jgi:hypothetical protein